MILFQIHAEQHYMGRNHKRKASGMDPLKPGYFNRKTGKWQRQPPGEEEQQEASNFVTLGGGSNPVIAGALAPPPPPPPRPMSLGGAYPPPPPPPGTEFSQSAPSSGSSPQIKQEKEAAPTPMPPPQGSQSSNGGRLFCDVCKVGATSQQQLDMHLNGKAHRARVEGRSPKSVNRVSQGQPPSRATPETPPNKVRLSLFFHYLKERPHESVGFFYLAFAGKRPQYLPHSIRPVLLFALQPQSQLGVSVHSALR